MPMSYDYNRIDQIMLKHALNAVAWIIILTGGGLLFWI